MTLAEISDEIETFVNRRDGIKAKSILQIQHEIKEFCIDREEFDRYRFGGKIKQPMKKSGRKPAVLKRDRYLL